jgi:hypothetical protein
MKAVNWLRLTVRWWKIKSGKKNFSDDPLGHGSSKLQSQVAVVTKFL